MDAPVHSSWAVIVFIILQKGNPSSLVEAFPLGWVCLSEWGRCRLVSACGTAECGGSAAASLVFSWAPEQRLEAHPGRLCLLWTWLGHVPGLPAPCAFPLGVTLPTTEPVLGTLSVCLLHLPAAARNSQILSGQQSVLIFYYYYYFYFAFATQGSVWNTMTCSICGKLSFTCKKCEITSVDLQFSDLISLMKHIFVRLKR